MRYVEMVQKLALRSNFCTLHGFCSLSAIYVLHDFSPENKKRLSIMICEPR